MSLGLETCALRVSRGVLRSRLLFFVGDAPLSFRLCFFVFCSIFDVDDLGEQLRHSPVRRLLKFQNSVPLPDQTNNKLK